MAGAARRGYYGEDGVYFDHRTDCRDSAHHKTCSGRWRGVVSLGFDADGKRLRRKVGLRGGSQSLTLAEATALLEAAESSRLHAFIVLCLLTGVRSEEARALTWEHVDLEAGTISVWRSVRAHGDTKTNRSRRTLKLPEIAVEALRGQRRRQAVERAEAGELWQEHELVFTTSVGTGYESHNLRRDFRRVTAAAGLGARWVPKELRTEPSFSLS